MSLEVADELLEALLAVGAEVEPAQPGHPGRLTAGDLVEALLHPRGEVVVDQAGEVPLQQGHHGEGQERGDQRGALLEHIAPVEDRAEDRGVRGRPPDLPVFQLLDQARLGVARRGPGHVAGRGQLAGQRVALGERRQAALPVVALGVVLDVLHVGLQEPVERDDLAGGGELGLFAAGRRAR